MGGEPLDSPWTTSSQNCCELYSTGCEACGLPHRAPWLTYLCQVNTFDLPHRVTTWAQLEDGQILWQILNDIDNEYFSESLPIFEESNDRRQSNNWIPKWQNLKHIERAVSTYIREECEQLPVLTKRMIPDLKTGAREGSTMLTAKLRQQRRLQRPFKRCRPWICECQTWALTRS